MSEQICDIEANGLKPTVIHCVVCMDYETEEINAFVPDTRVKECNDELQSYPGLEAVVVSPLVEFKSFAKGVTKWIGHNFIQYDAVHLGRLMGVRIKVRKIVDTLLLSRLQRYSGRTKHSLAAWGDIIPDYTKMPSPDNWDEFTPYMLRYCINDVKLNRRVAQYLKSEGAGWSQESYELERRVQIVLMEMKSNGFALDVPMATALRLKLKLRCNELEIMILRESPRLPKLQRAIGVKGVVTPKYKSDGKVSKIGLRRYGDEYTSVVGKFSAIKWEELDLNSPRRKLQWLAPYWNPTLRTKGYRKLVDSHRDGKISDEIFDYEKRFKWALDDINFATIKDTAPASIKYLGEFAMSKSRVDEIDGWFAALGGDNRVHGSVLSPGAVTHRAGHRSPNVANVPGRDSPYGPECRKCWIAAPGKVLVGTDASGIQMRILAHHLGDPDYIKTVVSGDVHNKHLGYVCSILGYGAEDMPQGEGLPTPRARAKTFIYAYVLGCGIEKTGQIWGVKYSAASAIKKLFPRRVPCLQEYIDELTSFTRQHGYYVGLDGRRIEVKSAHHALSCVLQGDESTIMKKAMVYWRSSLRQANWNYKLVNWVHDEWQTECTVGSADIVGKAQVASIVAAGEYYNFKAPLDGEYKIGTTWQDTH